MARWLLVDAQYLSHRAKHSTGSLSFEGQGTGVAFGVIRAIEDMISLHESQVIVLAFDHPSLGLRKASLPTYKSTRNANKTEEDKQADVLFGAEIQRLKKEILPLIGYRNILEKPGYEADDIIAKLAKELPENDTAVIISSDGDLLQCLSDRVICYNPTKKVAVTADDFRAKWKLDPHQWAQVKALAGCKTDDVVGIPGVGEMTAAGFFNGDLKESKDPEKKPGRYEKILANLSIMNKNLKLVKLPYPGLELPPIVPDEITEESKLEALSLLGIRPARRSARAKEKSKQQDGGFDI